MDVKVIVRNLGNGEETTIKIPASVEQMEKIYNTKQDHIIVDYITDLSCFSNLGEYTPLVVINDMYKAIEDWGGEPKIASNILSDDSFYDYDYEEFYNVLDNSFYIEASSVEELGKLAVDEFGFFGELDEKQKEVLELVYDYLNFENIGNSFQINQTLTQYDDCFISVRR